MSGISDNGTLNDSLETIWFGGLLKESEFGNEVNSRAKDVSIVIQSISLSNRYTPQILMPRRLKRSR